MTDQVTRVLRYDNHDAAVSALTALGFDMSNDFQPDGYCVGADNNSHYFNFDVYNSGTGILLDEEGNRMTGFYFGILWVGDDSSLPDFGSAVVDPPPSTAPVWGRAAQ